MANINDIFTYAKLQKQGNAYSYDTTTNLTEIQDCYGMSSAGQIEVFWGSLDREHRQLLTSIICRTQSYEIFCHYLKITIIQQHKKRYLADIDKECGIRLNVVEKREKVLQECKKPIYKKIAAIKAENNELKRQLLTTNQFYNDISRRCKDLEKTLREKSSKLGKLAGIQRLINLIKED